MIKYLCLLVFVLAAGCGGNGAELGPYPSSSETTGTQEQAATCGSCSFLETFSFSGAPGTFTQTNVTIPSGSGYPPGTLATIGTHLCGLGGITGTFSNTLAPNGAWQSNYLGYWSNNNTWWVSLQNGGGLPSGYASAVQVNCVPLTSFYFSGPSFPSGQTDFDPAPGTTYNRSNFWHGLSVFNGVSGSLTTNRDYMFLSQSSSEWSGASSNDPMHPEYQHFGAISLSWSSNPTLTFSGPYEVDTIHHATPMPNPQLNFCFLIGVLGPFGTGNGSSSVWMTNNGTSMTLSNSISDPHATYPTAQAYCVSYH